MSSLGLRTTGRAKAPLSFEIDRFLTDSDLEDLQHERGTKPPQITHLRERHHALAKLIAEGKPIGEAATITRYSISRASILLGDPAFQELVEHYKGLVNDQFVDFNKKLADLAIDAATLIQERMEDEEQAAQISTGQLLSILTVGADRTGHGPSSKTEVNVKVGLADRLAQARQRRAVMTDITPKDTIDGEVQPD